MTQVYDAAGRRVAVTLIEAGPCVVVQRKTAARDGYEAVQMGFVEQKPQRVNKAMSGHFAASGTAPHKILREVHLEQGEEAAAGEQITVSIFDGEDYLDVLGVTKGRGFQGPMKRHNMAGGRMTHGGHSKRRIGAIGECSYPARVAKGKRMPGHMGHVHVTVQNLKLVKIQPEDNLLLVQGAVPGPNGGIVLVRKSLKKRKSA